MGCCSLLKIIHVAVEDTADELSELNVTNKAVDELDKLMVNNEAKLVVAMIECQCNNLLCCESQSLIKELKCSR